MYYKSFSGADTLAFAIFPNCPPILLGSVTTISYSVYRDKKPVPIVGSVSVGGFTRGLRFIAGSMIFTLLNKHFVNELKEQISYLKYYPTLYADELPMFDIMLVSANEFGGNIVGYIYGVEFNEESEVTSIEDMFIENSFKYIAREINYQNDSESFINNFNSQFHTGVSKTAKIQSDFNYNATETLKRVKRSYLSTENNEEIIINNKNGSLIFNKPNENYKNIVGKIDYTSKIIDYSISKDFICFDKDKYIKIADTSLFRNYNYDATDDNNSEITINDYKELKDHYIKFNNVKNNLNATISAVSYNDDDTSIISYNKNIEENSIISFEDVAESFLYNLKLNLVPKYIEIIIFIGNSVLKYKVNNNIGG